MARGAALANRRCIGQSMRSGRLVVMTTLACGRNRTRSRHETAWTGDRSHRADVVNLIGVIDVARTAVAKIARESDLLIIGRAQDVRVRQVLTAVDAVDLRREADALFGDAVCQRRIVADPQSPHPLRAVLRVFPGSARSVYLGLVKEVVGYAWYVPNGDGPRRSLRFRSRCCSASA